MLIPRPGKGATSEDETVVRAVPPTPAIKGNKPPTEDVPVFPGTPALYSGQPDGHLPYTPTPLPYGYVPPGFAPMLSGHDPARDHSLTLLGALGALLGALIMVANQHLYIQIAGFMISAGGSITAALVILTSARGRRPAKRIVALIAGAFVTLLLTGAIATVHLWVLPTMEARGFRIGFFPETDPIVEEPEEQTLEPDTASEENNEKKPRKKTTRKKGKAASPDVLPEENPATPSSNTEAASVIRSNANKNDEKRKSPPVIEALDTGMLDDDILGPRGSSSLPEEGLEPTGTSISSSKKRKKAKANSVPMEVIDATLRSDIPIKKCFFDYQKQAGALPSRIDVRFTLEPSGRVSMAGITQAAYAGTALDLCLSQAIRQINFPTSSGSATKITFPFKFQ